MATFDYLDLMNSYKLLNTLKAKDLTASGLLVSFNTLDNSNICKFVITDNTHKQIIDLILKNLIEQAEFKKLLAYSEFNQLNDFLKG